MAAAKIWWLPSSQFFRREAASGVRHPSTLLRVDERCCERPNPLKEPAAPTRRTTTSALRPRLELRCGRRFITEEDAEEHNTSSRHLRGAPIRELHAVARGHRSVRRRPTHGRDHLRPPRPRSRRLLRPRPRKVSHAAAAEKEAVSSRRHERQNSTVEGALLSAMYAHPKTHLHVRIVRMLCTLARITPELFLASSGNDSCRKACSGGPMSSLVS